MTEMIVVVDFGAPQRARDQQREDCPSRCALDRPAFLPHRRDRESVALTYGPPRYTNSTSPGSPSGMRQSPMAPLSGDRNEGMLR